MPMTEAQLQSLALAYTGAMTSIRGRRVQRLVLRTFADFDLVVPATTATGRPALFALKADGPFAVCCTEGTGASAAVVHGNLAAGSVEVRRDLHKDSLPILAWAVRHSGLPVDWSPLTIDAAGMDGDTAGQLAALLATALAGV